MVVLATDFRPSVGGIAESLHLIAHHLSRHVPVTVMTTVPQSDAAWEHPYSLVQLPPLPERALGARVGDGIVPLRKLHTGAYFLALRRQASRAVRSLGSGATALVGSWDTAAHFWCEACHRLGVPYAVFVHGAEVLLPLYGSLPDWRRRDFARADHVLACSAATAELAHDRLGLARPAAVVNVPAGPRPGEQLVAGRAASLRAQLGLPRGPIVASVGRLVRRKGFDRVVRSVAAMAGECPDLSYVIAGAGPEAAELDALTAALGVGGRVRRLGEVDELTKWALYEIADVFAMPNRSLDGTDWEGFGIVFLEAALARRPSIAGRAGGTGDAVLDEVTGLRVDPEDQDALTAALRRLLGDPELRQRLGTSGEAMARTRFSGEAVAGRVWSALQ